MATTTGLGIEPIVHACGHSETWIPEVTRKHFTLEAIRAMWERENCAECELIADAAIRGVFDGKGN